ncbi:NnrS family protein, partial [Vibrio cholerae]
YQGPNMRWAFIALLLAALVRGVGVGLMPQHLLIWVNLSAALWVIAFALFVLRFGAMLLKSRVDGHPG